MKEKSKNEISKEKIEVFNFDSPDCLKELEDYSVPVSFPEDTFLKYKVIEIDICGRIFIYGFKEIDGALGMIYTNSDSLYILYRKITDRCYKLLKLFGYV